MPFYKSHGDPERVATLPAKEKKSWERMLVAVPKDMHSTIPVKKAEAAYSMYPMHLSSNPPDVVRMMRGVKIVGV